MEGEDEQEDADELNDAPPTPATFTTAATFSVPHFRIVDLYILDSEARSLCVLYLPPGSESVRMYLLFDWNEALIVDVNTGIYYVRITLPFPPYPTYHVY